MHNPPNYRPVRQHPWRLAPTLDGVSIKRSGRFAEYLASLPAEERRVIENAERAYVVKTLAPNSLHSRVAQDFNESMLGLSESYPHPQYRTSEGPIFLASRLTIE